MPNFAKLDENNAVVDIIVADNKEIADVITGTDCVLIEDGLRVSLGFVYEDNNFVNPNAPAPTDNSPPFIEGIPNEVPEGYVHAPRV